MAKELRLVWDSPVRVFHLLFAAGFLASFGIAKFGFGGPDAFPQHMMLGLALAALALLRIAWGLFGTRWARFSGLSLHPWQAVEYIRSVFSKSGPHHAGHNPATSIVFLLMLGLAIGLAVTGIQMGNGYEDLKEVHELMAIAFALLVVAHIAGVLLHLAVRKDGILGSMIHGRKEALPEEAIKGSAGWAGLAMAAAALWFWGSLLTAYNPRSSTTKWPITGQSIRLGEGAEEGEERSGGGEAEHGERDDDD